MTPYLLLVFLHVLGAVGLFMAWGVEGVALSQLARATTPNDARDAIALRRRIAPGGMVAMLTAVITGIWMMIVRWGHQPWEAGAMALLVAIIAVGIGFNGRAKPQLAAAMKAEDIAPARLRLTSAALTLSMRLRLTLGIGIIALMVLKPDVAGALAIGASAGAGCLTLAAVATRRGRKLAGARA